jgi:uncharacterized protein (DUF983 family)
MTAMREIQHPLARSLLRGLKGRCPACARGRLFWRYLKVNDRCQSCDHQLSAYPADDGPAYLTILVVGHLFVAPLLLFPIVWEAPAAWTVPILLTAMAAITLTALPLVKGAWIGLMYALAVRSSDARLHTADAAD